MRFRCTICGQEFSKEELPEKCPICGADKSVFAQIADAADTKNTAERFVIVGGGAAGFTAAKAIRDRNKTATIMLICGEEVIPYNRPGLSNALADGRSVEKLALGDYDYYIREKIVPIAYAKAEHIDAENKQVVMEDGERLDYDRLLLATGANAFNPVAKVEGAIPMSVLRTYADAQFIIQQASGKRVIIIGGGILGIEAVVALKKRGCDVTVLERGNRIVAVQADAHASELMVEALRTQGVGVMLNTSVASLDATGAMLADGTHIDADFALVSAGVRSEVTLARQLGLEIGRGIVVNDGMQTSMTDVYAAGDCAEYDGRVIGLWSAAVEQGKVAGAQMAGDTGARYQPILASTYFDGLGVKLFSAGRYNEDGLDAEVLEDVQNHLYKKLFFEGERFVGAVLYGNLKPAARVLSLLKENASKEQAMELLR